MNDTALYGLLSAALPHKVFKALAPMQTREPYVIYAMVTAVPQNTLCGYMRADEVHYRIDSYAGTDAEASQIMERIKRYLRAAADPPLVWSEQELYEQDTRIHRRSIDISTWYEPEQRT
jgi:Protein of unknown function (DUF3168)